MKDDVFEDLFGGEEEATAVVATVEPQQAAQPVDETPPAKRHGAIVWDIETGPRPWSEIESFYEPPPHPGEFDESSVKFGNTKDPAKRREKIDEAREKHVALVARWEDGDEAAKAEFLGKAALSPLTGRVVAIGYWQQDFAEVVGDGQPTSDGVLYNEKTILVDFWQRFNAVKSADVPMIGFNTAGFDLPFVVRRSWLLGVPVPGDAIRDNRYWHRVFIDLMQAWGCGIYGERCSLDRVSRYFGGPGKNGSGADFAALWYGSAGDRHQAVAYLKNDLAMTATVARRMGVL